MIKISVFNSMFDQSYSKSDDILRLLYGQESLDENKIKDKIGRNYLILPTVRND